MPPEDQSASCAAPSLLDVRSTGGIYAGRGFAAQERYVALRIPEWLGNPDFDRFQSERLEDVDSWFQGETIRHHHQVKNRRLAKGDVSDLIHAFRERNSVLIKRGVIKRYTIVCRELAGELAGFVEALGIYRAHHYAAVDGPEQRASENDLRQRADQLGLGDHFEFILAHAFFEADLAGLDRDEQQVRDRLAMKLAPLAATQAVPEAAHVADVLLMRLRQEPTRHWSRQNLQQILQQARDDFRRGPPRPRGDLVTICHQSLKRVQSQIDHEDVPDLVHDRRIRAVEIDQTMGMAAGTCESITGVVLELTRPLGPLRSALEQSEGELLYYGFPHVPLAVLAGYLAQPHRRISLVEHDLDVGRFRWRPASAVTEPQVHVTRLGSGRSARLRLSISAQVREEQCESVLARNELNLDIHVLAADLGRGKVGCEAQARHLARAVRGALDAHVAGSPDISSIHVFAAAPVSIAFLLGQILAHTALPNSYIYNFDTADKPPYGWSLSLRAAVDGGPCVKMFRN
jgi:hypothetical protein